MEKSLFVKYFEGKATVKEIKYILDWIAISSENKNLYIDFKKLYVLFSEVDVNLTENWHQIQEKLTIKRILLALF